MNDENHNDETDKVPFEILYDSTLNTLICKGGEVDYAQSRYYKVYQFMNKNISLQESYWKGYTIDSNYEMRYGYKIGDKEVVESEFKSKLNKLLSNANKIQFNKL